ncbi:hypothetical protein F9222_23655 [Escherichia coli]|nr:hypothetical protein F9222_23655 [Escherichia coli]
MTDISNVQNSIENTIYNYRTLAGKATRNDSNQTGVVAALERFFHKLEFLLKYGYLPVTKDTEKNGSLPAELKGLKDFLNNSSLKAAEPHYLQRNETERYRFSWNNESKLIVTREVFHASLAGARSGYACAGGWRAQETTENVDAALVLQAFNENSTEKPRQSGSVSEIQSVTDQGESVVTEDTHSSAGHFDTTATAVSTEAASLSVASATSQSEQSEPPQESIIRQSEDESVVTDDTHSSVGQLDAPVPADITEAASPSVASAAPQSLQQSTRADQNKAEQTAPAEQPEVTDTESKKTEELPMDKILEEQREELQREIEELRREIKERNEELKKTRRLFRSRTYLQDKLSDKENSIGELEKELQSFTEANSEEKQEKATSLQKRIEQSYWSYKKEWDLINARDLGDFLSQMFIENKIAHKENHKRIAIRRTEPFTWCLIYKFGRELRDCLSSRNERRVYSNNTKITVSRINEYNCEYLVIHIQNSGGDNCFPLPIGVGDTRYEKITAIASGLEDSSIREAIEYQTMLEKDFHKLKSERDAFTKAENSEEAYRGYYNRAILFEKEQYRRIVQQLSIAKSAESKITEIRMQLSVLEGKLANLEKIDQN